MVVRHRQYATREPHVTSCDGDGDDADSRLSWMLWIRFQFHAQLHHASKFRTNFVGKKSMCWNRANMVINEFQTIILTGNMCYNIFVCVASFSITFQYVIDNDRQYDEHQLTLFITLLNHTLPISALFSHNPQHTCPHHAEAYTTHRVFVDTHEISPVNFGRHWGSKFGY